MDLNRIFLDFVEGNSEQSVQYKGPYCFLGSDHNNLDYKQGSIDLVPTLMQLSTSNRPSLIHLNRISHRVDITDNSSESNLQFWDLGHYG